MAKTQNTEANYKVTISYCSKELSAVEKIKLKDLSDATKLDAVTKTEDNLLINPAYYAIVDVHNEKSEDKDYKNYVIVDKNGTKYYTGSQSFWSSFTNIMDELTSAGVDEDITLKAYRLPSKNREGKEFITCSLA